MRVLSNLALVTCAVLGVGVAVSAHQAPTTSTSTQVRQFEIVSVDGNKVVVKGNEGFREITVADDFRLTVDGRPVGVHDLKPGMKGTATVTTTTTSTPVSVTEVKDGVVMSKSGNSIIVRTASGIKMFSEGDVAKRGVRILRDGQPMAFTDLNTGDHLTATIVTTHPPKVMTQRQVEASMASAKMPEAAAAPAAAPSAPARVGSTASASAPAARQLPKTGGPIPLIGLVGAGSTLLGLALATLRRRRAA
jgi:LPXTG-motif cell wall-anchored protein